MGGSCKIFHLQPTLLFLFILYSLILFRDMFWLALAFATRLLFIWHGLCYNLQTAKKACTFLLRFCFELKCEMCCSLWSLQTSAAHLGLALNVSSWCWCLSFLGLVLCFQIWGQGDWMGIYTFWSFIYWLPQDSKKKLFVEVAAIESSLWGWGVVSAKTSRSCSEFPTRWFLLVY